MRIVDIKFDDYIQEGYYSERLKLDLRNFENCLTATKGMDKVYNLAANMGGIGFITAVGAEIMHDNLLINTYMLEASLRNKVKRYLFSSSACVYPTYKQKTPIVKGLKEKDAYPTEPDNFYGWEKLTTEKMCEAYQRDHGLDILPFVTSHPLLFPFVSTKDNLHHISYFNSRFLLSSSNHLFIDSFANSYQFLVLL